MNPNSEPEISVMLTEQERQLIIHALINCPFRVSVQGMQEIVRQVNAVIQKLQAKQEFAEDKSISPPEGV